MNARGEAGAVPLVKRLNRARRRAGGRTLDAVFRGLSAAGRLHPMADPARHGVEVARDVPYVSGAGEANWLDVYRPVGAHDAPVVVYVHGGGFRILSKETHWAMALMFARRGYVVFNVNYRLAPRHPFPAAVQDTLAAWLWVLDNAAAFGGDPSRAVFAGESAGANIATSMTLATTYRRPERWARDAFDAGVVPRAVVPACGILQVSDHERFARRRPLSRFVQDRLGEVSGGYLRGVSRDVSLDLADPLLVLERAESPERPLPPFFVSVGTRDPLLDDSRRLAAALERLGADCHLAVYPGEVHAFQAFLWREAARQAWRDTYAFLDRFVPPPA